VATSVQKNSDDTDQEKCKCSGDYRTLSLICYASKILLKVLNRRIENKAKDFIGENQFGFRKGHGTREAIGVLRTLCERSIEHDQEVYICFFDFEKAFDRGDWKIMMGVLKNIGVDWSDRRMIMERYIEQDAVVRVVDGEQNHTSLEEDLDKGAHYLRNNSIFMLKT